MRGISAREGGRFMNEASAPSRWRRLAVRAVYFPTLWWNRLLHATGIAERWNWIDDHVLLGALPRRRDLPYLRGLGITGVVNMCEECLGDVEALKREQLEQLHLPVLDYHSPTLDDICRAVSFIENHKSRGGKVYVHCKAGRGRSATVALCYLMQCHTLNAEEAFQRLLRQRSRVSQNLAERQVVRQFENHCQQL